jgi:hypothetical protein
MPTDTRDARADTAPVFLAWGMPTIEAQDGFFADAALWLTGGASLVLWTALALLLTA